MSFMCPISYCAQPILIKQGVNVYRRQAKRRTKLLIASSEDREKPPAGIKVVCNLANRKNGESRVECQDANSYFERWEYDPGGP